MSFYVNLCKIGKTIKERKNTSKLFEQQRKKEIERERELKKKYLKIFKMKIFIHFFLTESKQKYLSCVKL